MSAELCWNSACATLLTELGIDIKELLQKKYLKEYFVSAVRSENSVKPPPIHCSIDSTT